jgi:hypothetical protein
MKVAILQNIPAKLLINTNTAVAVSTGKLNKANAGPKHIEINIIKVKYVAAFAHRLLGF